jgi:hypothetical protein
VSEWLLLISVRAWLCPGPFAWGLASSEAGGAWEEAHPGE